MWSADVGGELAYRANAVEAYWENGNRYEATELTRQLMQRKNVRKLNRLVGVEPPSAGQVFRTSFPRGSASG